MKSLCQQAGAVRGPLGLGAVTEFLYGQEATTVSSTLMEATMRALINNLESRTDSGDWRSGIGPLLHSSLSTSPAI